MVVAKFVIYPKSGCRRPPASCRTHSKRTKGESQAFCFDFYPGARPQNKCGLGQPPKPHCPCMSRLPFTTVRSVAASSEAAFFWKAHSPARSASQRSMRTIDLHGESRARAIRCRTTFLSRRKARVADERARKRYAKTLSLSILENCRGRDSFTIYGSAQDMPRMQ